MHVPRSGWALKRFPGVRDWVNYNFSKYSAKQVRLVRDSPDPVMKIYKVQPKMCFLPTYENYIINVDGDLIHRKFEIEEESFLQEVEIKNMDLQ